MKKSPRFSRTLEFLKNNPNRRVFFHDQMVVVYSGEYGMFWRQHSAGYTPNFEEAGLYPFTKAWEACQHASSEKKLSFQIVSNETLKMLARKYARCVVKNPLI